MQNELFKTEKEAIQWVHEHMPFLIKPKRGKKTGIFPFKTFYAFDFIVEFLGKEIYKYQENSKTATNKDL